jgi:hypothetical protein
LIDSGRTFRKATRGGSVKAGYVAAFRTFVFSFNINTIPAGLIHWLQKGTKNMPARPIVDPTDKQTEGLSDAIWKSLKASWRRIGWFDRMGSARLTGFDRVDVR